jgi:tetratricopeptide (TPR) repeat protein
MKLREPDTAFRWHQHALLRLYIGDEPGYRGACARLQSRFRSTLHIKSAEAVTRSNLLAANPVADQATMLTTLQHLSAHQPYSSLYLLGLAHYRFQQDQEAIQRLKEALSDPNRVPHSSLSYAVLAMALHRQGRTAEAQAALHEMGGVLDDWIRQRYENPATDWVIHQGTKGYWPVVWWDFLEGQLLYREAKLLIDGVAPSVDPRLHVLRARALAGLRWSKEAVREYDAALNLNPDDRQVRCEAYRVRGHSFVQQRQWHQAAAEFAEACELQPDDAYLWRFLAVAYFAAGDTEAYRRTCLSMMEQFATTTDGVTAGNVLLACVLRDNALPDAAPMLALTLHVEPIWHWGSWAQGAALYRTGRWAEAAECFDSAATIYQSRPVELCFRSMAHCRLGQLDEARRCLAAAKQWVSQAQQGEPDYLGGTRPSWGDWHEPIMAAALLSEAETLIQSAGPG